MEMMGSKQENMSKKIIGPAGLMITTEPQLPQLKSGSKISSK